MAAWLRLFDEYWSNLHRAQVEDNANGTYTCRYNRYEYYSAKRHNYLLFIRYTDRCPCFHRVQFIRKILFPYFSFYKIDGYS